MIIYTDGGCVGNIGGWAYAIYQHNEDNSLECKVIGMGEKGDTTNNRMELVAVHQALVRAVILWQEYDVSEPITIRTDSKNVIGWVVEDWNINVPEIKELVDLIKETLERLKTYDIDVSFEWVKGHSYDVGNNFVDGICSVIARKSLNDAITSTLNKFNDTSRIKFHLGVYNYE